MKLGKLPAIGPKSILIAALLILCVSAPLLRCEPDVKPAEPASVVVELVEQSSKIESSQPAVVGVAAAPEAAVALVEPEVKGVAGGAPVNAPVEAAAKSEAAVAAETARRKARSEAGQPEAGKTSSEQTKSSSGAEPAKAEPQANKSSAKQATTSEPKSTTTKATKSSSSSNQANKAANKGKLPSNLGTVTSTGSSLYMSKHDAYSAIAEKHGSIVHDAMRKADKRGSSSSSALHRFSGIQKASALADNLNPFRGVTDSGLARTLGASMRSIMKSKYSVPAYVASALLGAVALMAFYESPISPLPVPPLPEPPVGRFPPEMPNLAPGTQVPFRTNQQMNYNQRYMAAAQPAGPSAGQQQVLFPGVGAQQRSGQVYGGQSASGIQLAAASLLGKQQIAQRKSGSDYEPSLTRSLFSSGNLSPPSNDQLNGHQNFKSAGIQSAASPRGATSFLSMLGLGSTADGSSVSSTANLAPNSIESKSQGSAGGQTAASIVNKIKSYFTRSAGPAHASGLPSPPSPSDPYQRMSFVQALMKEASFLPNFLNPSRKVGSSPSVSSTAANSNNKAQPVSAASAVNNSPLQAPTARMQIDNTNTNSKLKPAAGSYGLVKAADRLAHALLETWTSGLSQRSAAGHSAQSVSPDNFHKSGSADESQSASLATSFLTDLVSNYAAPTAHETQQQPVTSSATEKASSSQSQSDSSAAGRASDAAGLVSEEPQGHVFQSDQHQSSVQQQQQQQQQPKVTETQKQQLIKPANAPPAAQAGSGSESAAKIRKTRSIGLDYPSESQQDQRQNQQPSRAAQINNVIDYVSNSYSQNRLWINFVMNQVGLSQAVPYVERILGPQGAGPN